MGTFTHYLTVLEAADASFNVRIEPSSPLPALRQALERSTDLRYSPILPAYLTPGAEPGTLPITPASIAFFFSSRPYQSLGRIKPVLSQQERELAFFTEGLASIVLVDCDENRARELKKEIGCSQIELWMLRKGAITHQEIVTIRDPVPNSEGLSLNLPPCDDLTLSVYVEQIASSTTTLWAFYKLHFPEELSTLKRILVLTKSLVEHHARLAEGDATIINLRKKNAIISALVEISASLSYSVTQGTSGAAPILHNRSPFPHHSLLGVATAIRALTKFTRYLEAAFQTRSAADVIEKQYSTKTVPVPNKISRYESGTPYAFILPAGMTEEFDNGGDFTTGENMPLLAHFSLRHGYKEAKFSVTAASEALTAECLPAWTLMTLSHEIMHSRVRGIFTALFGITWDHDAENRWNDFSAEFNSWYRSADGSAVPLAQGIRNAVFNFCNANERTTIVPTRRPVDEKGLTRDDLLANFLKHQRLAAELFVHFHDYYFVYARQPRLYLMSLWATWTTVAAPVARPSEYLVRALTTIACGTGLSPRSAFDGAVEQLEESLVQLESVGIRSGLFDELRSLLSGKDHERIFASFKPAYYLIDQVRRNFASPSIAGKIDRLETDPFAEGSTVASEYSSSIYVYGNEDSGQQVSPIRYSLAALVRYLSGEQQIGDLQWLTAWNSMVIASQEVGPC